MSLFLFGRYYMEQFLVDLYAVVNIGALIFFVKKYGLNMSPGFMVFAFYVLVAVLAIPAYSRLPKDSSFAMYNFRDITLFPYFVYFIAMMFLLKPTFKFHTTVENAKLAYSFRGLKWFSYIYVASAIVTVWLMYDAITSQSVIENLAQVRSEMYEDESIQVYRNNYEHLFVTFTMFFQVPATLIFFLLLSDQRRKNLLFMIVFAIMIIAPTFLDAVRTASRGMVVSLFFRLLVCYGLFKTRLPKRVKRISLVVSIVLLVFFVSYSLLVTTARFGEDSSGINSLICYWGQPTLVFNSQVMSVEHFAYGKIFLKPVLESIGEDPSLLLTSITKNIGPCFKTMIGTTYLDFGIVGVILLAILLPAGINGLIYKSRSIDISKLYIILYYCVFLQEGALTIRYGFVVNVFYCIFFYFVLKLLKGTGTRKLNKLKV